jgi:hypothetical protein
MLQTIMFVLVVNLTLLMTQGKNTMQVFRETLAAVYLDWVNNYLTIEKFAEHKGLYIDEAKTLLSVAKQCFEKDHPES